MKKNFYISDYTTEHIQKIKEVLSNIAERYSLNLEEESMLYKAIPMLDDLNSYINSVFYDNESYAKYKYAILSPAKEQYPVYIGWVTDSELDSWLLFLDKNNTMCCTAVEAIKAFKAEGYKAVRFMIGKQYTILEDKNSTGE